MSKSGRKRYGKYPDERSLIEVIRIKRRARKRKDGQEQIKPTSYAQIARELNAEGYTTQTGKAWYPQMIAKILNRLEPQKKKQKKRPGLGVHDYLSHEQLKKCRSACPDRDRLILEMLVNVGLRASELCSMRIKDIGVYAGKSKIDIRGKGYEGEVSRTNDIAAEFAGQLRDYLDAAPGTDASLPGAADGPVFVNQWGSPLKYKVLYERIKSIGEKAGVEWLRPHKLRHTSAVFLYNYTLDILGLKKFLGHKSVKTTEIYADTLESKNKDHAEGLFATLKS